MQVRFTTAARRELQHILDVFGEFSGPLAVRKFGDLVTDKIEGLRKQPFTGFPEPLLAGSKYLFRAKLLNKNYKMIYLVTGDTIWIYDFWDMRRSPDFLCSRIKAEN